MTRTSQEYHARWQRATQEPQLGDLPWDEDVTMETCVIFESAHSSPMGEGATAFPDFGDAICWYRYNRVPDELEPQKRSSDGDVILPVGLEIVERRWEHRRPKPTDDQLLERRVTAEQALDELLDEFVQQGYRAEMSKRLQDIVNKSLLDFELHEVFVLPGDLDALFAVLGHPLAEYDAYETEDEAEAHAPSFNLNNSEHLKALKERIDMVGR